MSKKLVLNLAKVAAMIGAATLASCGSGACAPGTGNGSNGGTYNLVVDDTSPVPLINNNSQQFYIYMTNVGNGNASDLSWNIDQNTNSTPLQSIWGNIKNVVGLSSSKGNALQLSGDEIKIIDSSNCANVASGSSCRMLLQATDPSSVILKSTSKTSKSAITQNVISAYGYTPTYTGPSGTLTLSPLSPVNYGNGFASYTFFIINNDPNNAISLDQAPFGSLPAGINYSILAGQTCPNPLPAQSSCQVRMVLASPSGSTGTTTPVNLTPTGTVNGSVLPNQQSVTMTVSNEKLGNVTTSTPVMNVDANSTSTATSYAYISNTGSGSLSVGNISSSNSVMSISSDDCSGVTLLPGAVCRYQLNINPTQITSSGSAAVLIPYNDGKSSGTGSTTVSWKYSSAVTPAPGMTLISSGNLSQVNLTSTMTILNSGNVLLRNLGSLVATPADSHLSIANNNCGSSLLVGESCTYTLTYTPSAPSQNAEPISFQDITASYIDSNGVIQQISLPSGTSVTLSSTYQGLLNPNTQNVSLNSATPSSTITFKNDGNYKVSLAKVEVTPGVNLNITGGTCVAGDIEPGNQCTVVVSLQNSIATGSGDGAVTLVYNNNNGSPLASAISNINWLIGAAPSLLVNFGTSNLVAVIGGESTTQVTFKNNGNTVLNNITLPVPPTGFQWQSGVAPSCSTDNTQNLPIGDTCNLVLKYAPTTSSAAGTVVLGAFSATTGQGQPYTSSSPYTVSSTAISQSILTFSAPSIVQNPTWASASQISTVVVRNTDSSPITFTSLTSTGGLPLALSGCSGTLQSGDTCTLTINGGPYTASGNGSIFLNYMTPAGSKSQSIPVSVNYQAKPVIATNLNITSSPGGTLGIYNDGRLSDITLTLTNTTTVTNAFNPSTDGNVQVLASSLIPTSSDFGFVKGAGSTCVVDSNGYITIGNQAGNNSCTYVMTVNTTVAAGSPVTTVSPSQYRAQTYSASSTTPSYGPNQTGAPVSITTQSVTPLATLSAPTLVDPAQANALVVEAGIASPLVSFIITNNGETAVNGAISAPNIPGLVFDMSSCTNLAVNTPCTFTAQIPSTTAAGLSGNLNTQSLTYNNGVAPVTASFPVTSIPYSVNSPATPNVTMSTAVSNCQQGTGAAGNACLINTGNPAPVITLTFNNLGSGAATNFNILASDLNTVTNSLSTGGVYTLANNCVNANLAGSIGTCTVVISPIAANATASTSLYDLSFTLGYIYNYGTNGQLQNTVSPSSPTVVNVDVADPVVSIGAIPALASPGTATTTVTLSNWYGSLPSSPTFAITLNSAPAVGITASACTWTAVPPSGATCTTTLTNDGTAPGGTYNVTATSVGSTSTAQTVVVANPIPAGCANGKKCIFVTASSSNANLGGPTGADARCLNDSANPLGVGNGNWKALLAGNNSTTNGVTYYQADASPATPLADTIIAVATGPNLVGATATTRTISASGSNNYAWIGLVGGNCSNWTNGTDTTYNMNPGNSRSAASWYTGGSETCAMGIVRLFCVLQ